MDTGLVLMQLKWPADFILGRVPDYIESIFSFPIYYPYVNSFALSDNLLGNQVIWFPLYALTGNPILATNIWVLLCSVLNSVTMTAFMARTCLLKYHDGTFRHITSILFGVLFAFSTFRLDQHVHLQLFPQFWTPLALLSLEGAMTTRRVVFVIILSICMAMQWLSGVHLGMMCFIAVGLLGIRYVILANKKIQSIIFLIVSFLFSSILLMPVLIPALRAFHVVESYNTTMIAGACPGLGGFIRPFEGNGVVRFLGLHTDPSTNRVLFPGLATIFLTVTCFAICVRKPARFSRSVYFGGLAIVILIMASGTSELILNIPIFRFIRAPNRLAILAIPFMLLWFGDILGGVKTAKAGLLIIPVAFILCVLETAYRVVPLGSYMRLPDETFEQVVRRMNHRPVLLLPQAGDRTNDPVRARISQGQMELLSHSWTPGLAGRSGPRPWFVADVTRQSIRIPDSVKKTRRFLKRIRRLGYGAIILVDSPRSQEYRIMLNRIMGSPHRYGDRYDVYPLYDSVDSIPFPDDLYLGKQIETAVMEKDFIVRRGRGNESDLRFIIVPTRSLRGIVQNKFDLEIPITMEYEGGIKRIANHRIEIGSITDKPDLGISFPIDIQNIQSCDIAGVNIRMDSRGSSRKISQEE